MAKENDRKSHSVWLKARHIEMLEQMPGVNVGDLTRKAIEEQFEGRNDRGYAEICVEADIADMTAEWERLLGITSSTTVTATEDGFRIVVIALKKFNDG